ncbi:uncharacterized protein SPAPADRAFT_135549, partial [Spathaspora passalidarum NRRL Y-27907]
MFRFLIFTILTFAIVSAEQISGIFTSFDSLVWQQSGTYPYTNGPGFASWIATLSWKIDGSTVSPGDTFTLNLPCVFKFTSTTPTVNLTVGSVNYATCTFNPGDVVVSFSQLQCVLLDTVTPSLDANGSINFPIVFNVGGSALNTDLQDSTCFHSGQNTVSFYDGNNQLSTQATFNNGSFTDPNSIVFNNRAVPSLNKQQHYLLAGNCPAGYRSGSIGMNIQNSGSQFDCSSIQMAITNALNDWYFPETAGNFSYTYSCSSTSFVVNYKNIPAGYRPFIDALVQVNNGVSVVMNYVNTYTCTGSRSSINNGGTTTWGAYENNDAGGNGEAVEVVTQTYTGSTTKISTMPFSTSSDTTKTIVVNVPIPTVTTTTTYVGISTSYTTKTALPGSTANVIEYNPVHTTTTVTTCSPGQVSTITTTYSTSTWATDTVFIVTECPSPSSTQETPSTGEISST